MNEFDELIIEYIKEHNDEPPLFLLNLFDVEEATRILKERNGKKIIWQETDEDTADGGTYRYV
jgi:hypothetical protein